MFSVQVHSAEAAAQSWGTDSCQEVSLSDSLVVPLPPFHTCDGRRLQLTLDVCALQHVNSLPMHGIGLCVCICRANLSSKCVSCKNFPLCVQSIPLSFHSAVSCKKKKSNSLYLHYSSWAFRQQQWTPVITSLRATQGSAGCQNTEAETCSSPFRELTSLLGGHVCLTNVSLTVLSHEACSLRS